MDNFLSYDFWVIFSYINHVLSKNFNCILARFFWLFNEKIIDLFVSFFNKKTAIYVLIIF